MATPFLTQFPAKKNAVNVEIAALADDESEAQGIVKTLTLLTSSGYSALLDAYKLAMDKDVLLRDRTKIVICDMDKAGDMYRC